MPILFKNGNQSPFVHDTDLALWLQNGWKRGPSETINATMPQVGISTPEDFGDSDATDLDTPRLQAAFNRSASTGDIVQLNGSYTLSSRIELTQGNTYRVSGSGSITGTGGTIFNITGASLSIHGSLELLNSDETIKIRRADAATDMVLELVGVSITGATFCAINDNISQPVGTKFSRFILDRCIFSGNNLDVQIFEADLENVAITNCLFENGGSESLNFQGGTNQGTHYIFSNCIFRNYTNTRPNPDADGHFIRCYGQKAVIADCHFSSLTVSGGTTGSDTEALRPNCDDLTVTGCTFTDAGMAEAVLTLKGCRNAIVQGNRFVCTDAYNSISDNPRTVGVLASVNSKIIGNVFENFSGAAIDTEDTVIQLGTIEIKNNTFVDCQCDQYSSNQIIRLTADQTTFVIEGNVVKTSEPTNKFPVRIFRFGTDSTYYIRNNRFYGTDDSPFDNVGGLTEIYSENNIYENFTQFLSNINSVQTFVSKNDVWILDRSSSYPNWISSNDSKPQQLHIEGLTLKWSAPGYSGNRLLGFKNIGAGSALGEIESNLRFIDGAGTTIAHHHQRFQWASDGATMSFTTPALDEFDSAGVIAATTQATNVISNFIAIQKPSELDSLTKVEGTVSVYSQRVD